MSRKTLIEPDNDPSHSDSDTLPFALDFNDNEHPEEIQPKPAPAANLDTTTSLVTQRDYPIAPPTSPELYYRNEPQHVTFEHRYPRFYRGYNPHTRHPRYHTTFPQTRNNCRHRTCANPAPADLNWAQRVGSVAARRHTGYCSCKSCCHDTTNYGSAHEHGHKTECRNKSMNLKIEEEEQIARMKRHMEESIHRTNKHARTKIEEIEEYKYFKIQEIRRCQRKQKQEIDENIRKLVKEVEDFTKTMINNLNQEVKKMNDELKQLTEQMISDMRNNEIKNKDD